MSDTQDYLLYNKYMYMNGFWEKKGKYIQAYLVNNKKLNLGWLG